MTGSDGRALEPWFLQTNSLPASLLLVLKDQALAQDQRALVGHFPKFTWQAKFWRAAKRLSCLNYCPVPTSVLGLDRECPSKSSGAQR